MNNSLAPFLYSCAGQARSDEFDRWFEGLLSLGGLGRDDAFVLRHTLSCGGSGGYYPSVDYYRQYYGDPGRVWSVGELAVLYGGLVDRYSRDSLVGRLSELMATTDDVSGLLSGLRDLCSGDQGVSDSFERGLLERLGTPHTYSAEVRRPVGRGIMLGIPEIDDVTNGFQGGNIATIAGFTGSGKSVMCLSTLYKAASEGKYCVYLSLELPRETVWLYLQARYLYEVKGMHINSLDLLHHKLSGDRLREVESYEADYARDIQSRVLVLDESFFTKSVFMDVDMLRRVWRALCGVLGGLDLVCVDHVGQLDLLYQDRGVGLGNAIIVKLRQSVSSFSDDRGIKPVLLFACQTNRQGWLRARRAGGVYDTTAVSDLNEVERSSSYLCFIYTEPELVEGQECKVMMTKHRFGPPVVQPAVAQFLPGVCTVGEVVRQMSFSDEFSAMEGSDFGSGSFGGDLGGGVTVDF